MAIKIKKLAILTAVIAVMGFTSSCTQVRPGMVTTAKSIKRGEARKKVWFGLAFNVDISAATAAKNGGLTKIATVDHGIKGGLFSTTYFTIVTGE